MDRTMGRREFMATMGAAAAASPAPARSAGSMPGAQRTQAGGNLKVTPKGKIVLRPFDYRGVTLLPGRWQRQYQSARDYYLGVSDDNILCGFRRAAGLNAPGQPLGGWASPDSSVVFGQWLQMKGSKR